LGYLWIKIGAEMDYRSIEEGLTLQTKIQSPLAQVYFFLINQPLAAVLKMSLLFNSKIDFFGQ
jgi:hypothetical protein